MTLLVASIFVENLAAFETAAQFAWDKGADAVELRIDRFDDAPDSLADYLRRNGDRTWIVTCRPTDEGGDFDGDTMRRVSLLLAICRGTGAWVDFEQSHWQRSSNIRQKVRLASDAPDESAHRLILSQHDLSKSPLDPNDDVIEEILAAPGAAAAKLAYCGADIHDSFLALDTINRHGARAIAICMGEAGLWTRVLAKKLGAFATYGSLTPEASTAPGQVTIDEMRCDYRWPSLNSSTRVFGVIGDPVAHSLGPRLFNAWFDDAGMNAVYLPLRVPNHPGSLRRFLDKCQARPWLDIGGLSVTLPHKPTALECAGDGADAIARRAGAVNTLVIRDGHLTGHNTDCRAAVESLALALNRNPDQLAGLTVDVLGTGGAARAVLAGLTEVGCRLTVYGRSAGGANDLAEAFGCQAAAWDRRKLAQGEVLINATSVGLAPHSHELPMPTGSLAHYRLVFDLIYNPLRSLLLSEAERAGVATLSGLDMFLGQAAAQFELFTGEVPDIAIARQRLTDILQSQAHHPA